MVSRIGSRVFILCVSLKVKMMVVSGVFSMLVSMVVMYISGYRFGLLFGSMGLISIFKLVFIISSGVSILFDVLELSVII